MNFRIGVSSGCVREVRCFAELKTSSAITGAKLQTTLEVLDSKNSEWAQEYSQWRFQEKSLSGSGRCAQRKKLFSREGMLHGWSMSCSR